MSSDFLLHRHRLLPPSPGPVVLLILDGVGIGKGDEYDAVALARTPTMGFFRKNVLATCLKAHGTAVGLPTDDDIGNSEVGHNTLGAGRIFDQGAKCVDNAVESGAIWKGFWHEMVEQLKKSSGALHLIGLLSDGNVHSNEAHLHALIRRAHEEDIERLYVHVLLDGRDVPDHSAPLYVTRLEEILEEIRGQKSRNYRIASGGGRMITTMDRYEADWGIVERGWKAHVHGEGEPFSSALDAIETSRKQQADLSDQYIPAFSIHDSDNKPVGPIADGDAVIFFNFRGDRALEISRAFTAGPEFEAFDRGNVPKVTFAGMTLYDGDLGIPEHYLVAPPEVQRTMSEYLARNGIPQFACAETQKFGHVTYFWNGNRSGKFDDRLEAYLEIPSDQVPFEQRPWMKSAETADAVNRAIAAGNYRFIRANFAGGDMVGHTGSVDATVIAIEAIDLAMRRIVSQVARAKGCLVVTADHGNSEDMVERDDKGQPLMDANHKPRFRTAHSLNPVPFFISDFSGRDYTLRRLPSAGLSNVAATVVELLGYEPPNGFDPSLIESKQTGKS